MDPIHKPFAPVRFAIALSSDATKFHHLPTLAVAAPEWHDETLVRLSVAGVPNIGIHHWQSGKWSPVMLAYSVPLKQYHFYQILRHPIVFRSPWGISSTVGGATFWNWTSLRSWGGSSPKSICPPCNFFLLAEMLKLWWMMQHGNEYANQLHDQELWNQCTHHVGRHISIHFIFLPNLTSCLQNVSDMSTNCFKWVTTRLQ